MKLPRLFLVGLLASGLGLGLVSGEAQARHCHRVRTTGFLQRTFNWGWQSNTACCNTQSSVATQPPVYDTAPQPPAEQPPAEPPPAEPAPAPAPAPTPAPAP